MNSRTPPARRHVEAATDATGVSRIGGRPIHAYWLLLAPHLRDVFLAPERHLGDHTLAWSWNTSENDSGDDVSPTICADARARLAAALERLREDVAEKPSDTNFDERRRLLRELAVSLERWAAGLINGTDTHVAGFLARTSHGLMFHSWGLAHPARPVAASTSGEQDDGFVASPAGSPTTLRRLLRSRLLRLATITALVLGVLAGMWTCARSPTTSTTPETAAIPPKAAAREIEGTTTSPERNDAASPAASVVGKSPASGAQTAGTRPPSQVRHSTSTASDTSWSTSASRRASPRSPAGETFEGRDAAPALPSGGLAGAARVGGAAAAGASSPSMTPAAAAGAGQTSAGASSTAGGAPAPVSASALSSSGTPSAANTSPAAVPSGGSSAGERTTVSPDDDSPIATDATAPATLEPQPPAPVPSGEDANDSVEPVPRPSPSETHDPAKEPPSPNPSRKRTSDPSDEAERSSSTSDETTADNPNRDQQAPDDTGAKATDSTAPAKTTHSSREAGTPTRDGSDQTERADDEPVAADPLKRAVSSPPDMRIDDRPRDVRFRTHTWRAELLRDAILPTTPQPVGQVDAVTPMRAQLWQQHHAVRPSWMDHPRIHIGTTLRWSNTTDAGELHLDGIDGQSVAARWVSANELELSWPSGAAPAVVTMRAGRAGDDRTLARMHFSADLVEARAHRSISVRTWLSIDLDGPATSADHEWRLIAGPLLTLPVVAPGAESARIELASNAGGGGLTVRTLAIMDPGSGWALVGEVEMSSGSK